MDSKRGSADLKQLTLLYVEDEASIRHEVSHFLERQVGRLLTAGNGEEGLAIYHAQRPDMVLSDIQMPVLDGLAMAEEIKRLHHGVPLIFATAFNDNQYLQRAIAVGADGYALKPIDLDQLLQTLLRSVDRLMQTRELTTSRAQLAAYHQAAEEERRLVADLMSRMMRPENLNDRQLRYWLRPAGAMGGDLVAVARNRNNKLYLMLADSSGRGLPATFNLLPINHIFYSMVSKNLPVSLMVEEMNWAVRNQSPSGHYIAALVACIDSRNRLIEVWNGGMPGAIHLGDSGDTLRRFESANHSLGVLDRTFTAQTDIYQWAEPGQLLVYSDGLEDAENEAGSAFGSERILETIKAAPSAGRFERLIAALEQHLGARHAQDDMTLIAVASLPPEAHANDKEDSHYRTQAGNVCP